MPACVTPMEEESESRRRSMNPSTPTSRKQSNAPPCYVLAVSLKQDRTGRPSRCIVLRAALAAFHGGIVRRPAASPVFGFCRKWPCRLSQREKGTSTICATWDNDDHQSEVRSRVGIQSKLWTVLIDRSSSSLSPYSRNLFQLYQMKARAVLEH
jgi:hypothetical protein